jgi:hypothetical protein
MHIARPTGVLFLEQTERAALKAAPLILRGAAIGRATLLTRTLLRSASIVALFLYCHPLGAAAQDASACSELVEKSHYLARRGNTVFLSVDALGAITYVRSGGAPSIFSGLLLDDDIALRAPDTTFPAASDAGSRAFRMWSGGDRSFPATSLSGKASILMTGRYDRVGIALTSGTGTLQWVSYTWAPGVNTATSTTCKKLGSVVLLAGDYPGTTTAQRTLPIVQVDAAQVMPGYGIDSFRLLLMPRTVYH